VSDAGGAFDVYVMAADGSRTRKITTDRLALAGLLLLTAWDDASWTL
jgi:hypothetical protein